MPTAVLEREQAATAFAPAAEKRVIDGVPVEITYANADDALVGDEEIRSYIARGNTRHQNTIVAGLKLAVDGGEVGITYDLDARPFDRIRRITGYLVGTLDRFNDAKRAEERDRVKHGVPGCCCGE